jgi:hypothetical protein
MKKVLLLVGLSVFAFSCNGMAMKNCTNGKCNTKMNSEKCKMDNKKEMGKKMEMNCSSGKCGGGK